MSYLPGYIAVTVATIGIAKLAADACDWFATGSAPRYLRPFRTVRTAHPRLDPPIVHQLELTRLAHELARVRDARQPGLHTRIAACTAAYDEALLRCASSVGLDVPPHVTPLADDRRFDLESRLVGMGVDW